MTLADLAAIGSLVGSVAVLASLVYLALQVRHADRNQQAAIRHSRISRLVDMQLRLAEPGPADIWRKGLAGEEATQTEINQFLSLCLATFFHMEDTFYQHEEGLLNGEAFETAVGGMRHFSRNPGARVIWKSVRHTFSGKFLAFMDGVVAAPVPPANFPWTPDAWKIASAAEKAHIKTGNNSDIA